MALGQSTMNQNTMRPPEFRGRVQTLIGGVALVVTGFGAWWMWLQKYDARKERTNPAALPTWAFRIYNAQHPADGASNPATPRQGSPLEPSTHPKFAAGTSSARADKAVPSAPQTKSGLSAPNVEPSPGPEPTPQRTNGDGRVYTKAPAYLGSYTGTKSK